MCLDSKTYLTSESLLHLVSFSVNNLHSAMVVRKNTKGILGSYSQE